MFKKERIQSPFHLAFFALEIDEATSFCLQISSALFHLHKNRLVHRNVTTSSIHLVEQGTFVLGGFESMIIKDN